MGGVRGPPLRSAAASGPPTIPSRGRSTSPIRAAADRSNPVAPDLLRIPSRTFVRSVPPLDLLDAPERTHPRARLATQVTAPLFMGGGTVEGHVRLAIDRGPSDKDPTRLARAAVAVGRLSVDLLGVETAAGKHFIFRTLACDLVDEARAPPPAMRAGPRPPSDAFWAVVPSVATLPFRLNLPVHMGPPPCQSRSASIRYLLCTTLVMRMAGKVHVVRVSQEIAVLTVLDREWDASLPSIVCAELTLPFQRKRPW